MLGSESFVIEIASIFKEKPDGPNWPENEEGCPNSTHDLNPSIFACIEANQEEGNELAEHFKVANDYVAN